MKREVNRYRCIGDDDREYTVIEYQHFTRFQPLDGSPARESAGKLDWILSDDRDVNFIDDQTFQILDADEIIRKID